MPAIYHLLAFFGILPVGAQPVESFFDSKGVRIRYLVEGKGEPVVLVHGFTASADTNWVLPGILRALASDHKVIALDCRGHGKSDKPHDPTKYGVELVQDVVRLMDHLGIKKAHIVGYSMGSMITLKLMATHPERLLTATLGGGVGLSRNGYALTSGFFEPLASSIENGGGISTLSGGLAPPDQPKLNGSQNKALERLFTATHDRKALAACVRGWKALSVPDEQLAANRVPALALIGTKDPLKIGVDAAKNNFGRLKVVELEGAGHLTAPGHPQFLKSLTEFLSSNSTR